MKTAPCGTCGRELIWGLAPWPLETTPCRTEMCASRAYVIARAGGGRFRVTDVRDIADPPDMAYPQHICHRWREESRAPRTITESDGLWRPQHG